MNGRYDSIVRFVSSHREVYSNVVEYDLGRNKKEYKKIQKICSENGPFSKEYNHIFLLFSAIQYAPECFICKRCPSEFLSNMSEVTGINERRVQAIYDEAIFRMEQSIEFRDIVECCFTY